MGIMKRIHFRKLVPSLLMALMTATGISGAYAQVVVCADRDLLVRQLQTDFKEKPNAYGLVGSEALLEVLVSEDRTWTIIVTDPTGRSCIIAAGHSWDQISVSPGIEIRRK